LDGAASAIKPTKYHPHGADTVKVVTCYCDIL